jgi:hypothetical protein
MNKFAIQGHATRGREVIAVLESAGGNNHNNLKGTAQFDYYWIDPEDNTININSMQYIKNHYGVNEFYTLEEFVFKESNSPEKECTNMTEALNFCQTLKELSADVYYTNPIKEETMEERDEKPVNRVFDTDVISFDIAQKDKYELDLQGKFEVVLREGKYYVERIKPTYPKDYTECEASGFSSNPVTVALAQGVCMGAFAKLIVLRNAYWKIAGEQMGLGKPWEPDWCNGEVKWCMSYSGYCIEFDQYKSKHHILAFPTPELRDIFLENFRELIEECKELI